MKSIKLIIQIIVPFFYSMYSFANLETEKINIKIDESHLELNELKDKVQLKKTLDKIKLDLSRVLPAEFIKVVNSRDPIQLRISKQNLSYKVDSIKNSVQIIGTGIGYSDLSNNYLVVDSALLELYFTNPEIKVLSHHNSIYQIVLSVFIHELSHFYDEYTKVSQSSEFQSAAGWLDHSNYLKFRSPDGYEFTNEEESFAVNMEYFILDKSFKCQKPSLFYFFEKLFFYSQNTFQQVCSTDFVILNNEFNINDKENIFVKINRNKIFQVHYLHASEGDSIVSGFGHSMLRLIICSPERIEVGPECLKDIQYHQVVSFAAQPFSSQMNIIEGVTGAYPLRLFIIPFSQIIKEYTLVENRNLESLPINLNKNEMNDFINKVEEYYWFYQSNYTFFSKNCATSTFYLLASVIENNSFRKENISSPTDLYDLLKEYNLVDTKYLEDKKISQTKGYFFESFNSKLKLSIEIINSELNSNYSLNEYMQLNSVDRFKLILKSKNQNKLIAALTLLEDRHYSILMQYLWAQIGVIKTTAILPKANDIENKLIDSMKIISMIYHYNSNPNILLGNTAYGIPTLQELEASPKSVIEYLIKNISNIAIIKNSVSRIQLLFSIVDKLNNSNLQKEYLQLKMNQKKLSLMN